MTRKLGYKSGKPATGEEIKAITGLEDHGYITAVLKTGATPAQVLQAFQWLESGEHKNSLNSMDSAVRCVCEILEANEEMNVIAEHL